MSKRASIPSRVIREVLYRNEAACCICGKSNVQIHHIDGNNSNNEMKNLAVLCNEHHDQASSRSSMTRRLDASLVRRFKVDWEARISRKRRIARSNVAKKRDEKAFINFEIKRLVYSLPAFSDKKSTISIFGQLYSWHLFSDTTKNILAALGYIRWFLNSIQIVIVLERLWEFFWQFVGPKDVPMNRTDEKELFSAIGLVGDLGVQTIIMGENPRVFDNLFYAMKRFEEVAANYNKPSLKNGIKNQLKKIMKELRGTRGYPKKKALLAKLERRIRAL